MKVSKIFASFLALFLLLGTVNAQTDIITPAEFMALAKNNDKLVIIGDGATATERSNNIIDICCAD